MALNLYKGVLASVFILVALILSREAWSLIDFYALSLLLISGAVGIGLGDTAFFAALNRMGERRTVLLAETVAPPLTVMIAALVLAELLSFLACLGVIITVAGVAWVILEQTSASDAEGRSLKAGIMFGLVAALCQSAGAVLSRAALTHTNVTPLQSSLIRILGGVAILLILLPAARVSYFPKAVRSASLWKTILLATFVGTFLGIFLQQSALNHAPAGIVQTLIATSSLFILPLVALKGERVSGRAIFGACIAVVGVALLLSVG